MSCPFTVGSNSHDSVEAGSQAKERRVHGGSDDRQGIWRGRHQLRWRADARQRRDCGRSNGRGRTDGRLPCRQALRQPGSVRRSALHQGGRRLAGARRRGAGGQAGEKAAVFRLILEPADDYGSMRVGAYPTRHEPPGTGALSPGNAPNIYTLASAPIRDSRLVPARGR